MSTPFKLSPIWDDISDIIWAPKASGFYTWKVEFKIDPASGVDLTDPDIAQTEREQEGFFEPWRIPNIDFVSNYESRNFEALTVTVQFTLGMWLKAIFPSRRYLMATITRTKLINRDSFADEDEKPLVFERKVFITPSEEQLSTQSPLARLSRRELDMRDMIRLELELLDPAVELISQIAVGGNFRRCTAADVMLGVFQKALAEVNVNGEPAVQGFNVLDGRCDDKREHVVIDQPTSLLKVPYVLQHKCGGIWPTGMGHFFQHGIWWFYPPYDATRFEKTTKTMTIFKVPTSELAQVENTIKVDGDKVRIVSTDVQAQVDDTDTKYLTQGDGVRYSNTATLDTDWIETKDNKAIARRANSNNELRINDKIVQHHYTRASDNRFTSNSLVEYSSLAARAGYVTTVIWDNADQGLIYPAMPIKIIELKEDAIKETEGVLLNAQVSAQIHDKSVSASTHKTTIVLSIFCVNKGPSNDQDN